MGDIVTVSGLRKTFPKRKAPDGARFWTRWRSRRGEPPEVFVAVDDVSFTIAEGEIFGLLGPNGAGKTTTIRMLCTLLEPTRGAATINGYDIVQQANGVRQSLGAVLTGERSIYWKLTGRENLEYFAALYHLPPAVARRQVDALLDRLDLAGRADDLVERYSTGMKQRIAIAKALLANPPVVLLDEPTAGLDPQSARNLREIVLEIKREGRTVLLTTHYMEEADQLCDRVGIIDRGKIIALDTPANLKRTIDRLEVVDVEIEGFDPVLADTFQQLLGVHQVVVRPNGADNTYNTYSVALHTDDSRAVLPALIERISAGPGRIRDLRIVEATLEDVFISLTGKQLRD